MKAAVVGYASIDRSILVDRTPTPGVTSRVVQHLGDSSRPGGIAHAVGALLEGGVAVTAICAVGTDDGGLSYVETLASWGCAVDGITTDSSHSPSSDLIYGPDGETVCIFDAGGPWDELSTNQRAEVASADLLVVMIGPPQATYDALKFTDDGAAVAWVVKADSSSHNEEVTRALGQRADIVFHNRAESSIVAAATDRRTPTIVTTDGPNPITVTHDGSTTLYEVPRLDVVGNPTGAGDGFAGGFLGPWLLGRDQETCVAAGLAASGRLVRGNE